MSSPHDPVAAAPSSRRIGGTLSIDWKLPLLITAVLAAGLAAFLAFTYFALTRRTESIARDRFASATRLVARSVQDVADQRRKLTGAAVKAPELARLLTTRAGTRALTSDSAAAGAVLSRLLTPDSLGVWLMDAGGRVVVSVGQPLPASTSLVDPRTIAPLQSDDAVGAVRFGPMVPVGDRTLFWVVAPVMADTGRIGYVLEPRWVTGPPSALQTLRDLTREDLALYLRNTDGSGWTYAPGHPAPPPVARDSTSSGVYYERPGTGRMIAEETPVAGTPWLVVIDSPSRLLFSRLRTTIEQLAWMSLLLLAVGAAIAWAVGRRITRPIVALTSAANQVATGTYESPIPLTGADEIGQLARRFHEMAEQVTEARRELEQRATHAQQVADELAGANRRLQTTMQEAQAARSDAERAKTEAETANRAKGDFLAMMSHELRTPLNAIAGYAELIEMGIHGPVTDAQRDALNRIARSQAHLLTLINDVLNFARIDAGQITYVVKDVRMSDTLGGLEPLVGPQVAARRLTFAYDGCDVGIVAAADPDKVRQVVINLLSNAVKYTTEGGRVELSCDADESVVRVHVRDTGPGIEAEQLPVIFEAFVQGHRALNRPNEGVGLGLAISRDLARGMGGDVTVTTELGVGSTFTLVLPRAGVKASGALASRGSATVA
ncbi:MAG TPA: ATP-binding protein [Gemmatimonadaceae bacterium]|nr:ATP-binding protein [Gemmatimonadaceae bacterium]